MRSTGDASPDLCVIGAGDSGMAVAIGAVAIGLSVVMIDDRNDVAAPDLVLERLRVAASRVDLRRQAGLGVSPADFADTMAQLRADLPRITADRRLARLAAMNIRVIRGTAAFVDATGVSVNGEVIRSRRFIIATGARQFAPPWLSSIAPAGFPSPAAGEGRREREASLGQQSLEAGGDGYLSIRDLHRLSILPDHLVIVGGDRDAWTAAQSFARFGTAVTVLEAGDPDPEIDPELLAPVRRALVRDGVGFAEIADILEGARTSTGFILNRTAGLPLAASHLLLAQPARPALDGLALEGAGVRMSDDGTLVLDTALRTTNPRIFAVGGAAGARSAQEGQAQVGGVLRAAFFRLPSGFRREAVPQAFATSPPLAWVGLSEAAARASGPLTILRWPFSETDAGRATGQTVGHVKIVADARGRVLGAGVVGEGARDLIGFWTLAVSRKLTVRDLANIALPIPSMSEAMRRAMLTQAARDLGNPWIKRALRLARWLG